MRPEVKYHDLLQMGKETELEGGVVNKEGKVNTVRSKAVVIPKTDPQY